RISGMRQSRGSRLLVAPARTLIGPAMRSRERRRAAKDARCLARCDGERFGFAVAERTLLRAGCSVRHGALLLSGGEEMPSEGALCWSSAGASKLAMWSDSGAGRPR